MHAVSVWSDELLDQLPQQLTQDLNSKILASRSSRPTSPSTSQVQTPKHTVRDLGDRVEIPYARARHGSG